MAAEALIPAFIQALGLGAAGTAAKGTMDMMNSDTGKTRVLGDELTDKLAETPKKEVKPKDTFTTPKEIQDVIDNDLYLSISNHPDKDGLLTTLGMAGLSSPELKKIGKTGAIPARILKKLSPELMKDLATGLGITMTPQGSKTTTLPIPEKHDWKETFPSESGVDIPSTTTIKKMPKPKSDTTIEPDGVKRFSRTDFPGLTDDEFNLLKRTIDYMYKGNGRQGGSHSDGTKPEPSPRDIVDYLMSFEGRKFMREHPDLTDGKVFDQLVRESQENAAYNARQRIIESNVSASGEARKNAKDSARENARRNAERENDRLEEMGLNPYIKKH